MLHRLTKPTLNFRLRPATNFQRSRLPAAIVILLLARVALGRRIASIAAALRRRIASIAAALPGRAGLTIPPIVTRGASAILIGRRLHVAAARLARLVGAAATSLIARAGLP